MRRLLPYLLLFLLVCPYHGTAQVHDSVLNKIVRLNIPTDLCASSQYLLNFGYGDTFSVVLTNGRSALGRSDRIFLPDGVPCGTLGCSYRSPVTFTDFNDTSTITSVEDIRYVRINMEHSYVGDIYINITCPNQQQADILRYGGTGTSSCLSSISSEHRGWSTRYGNVSTSIFLGVPVDHENSANKCDSTDYQNRPGIGWNYCWSDSYTSNYTYGAADGIIYRAGNRIGRTIDSSNVAAGTHFYHPDESFSSLIGCPLNGTWWIEVMDGWDADNGYIFSWEIVLNENLLPADTCMATSYQVTGNYITRIDSNSFLIDPPEGEIVHDTVFDYFFRVITSCGDTNDTTVSIRVHPEYAFFDTVAACYQYQLNGTDVFSSVDTVINYLTQSGCDSVWSINITIYDSTVTQIDTATIENNLPFAFNDFILNRTDLLRTDTVEVDTLFRFVYSGHDGCDSIVLLHLSIFFNDTVHRDSVVCDNRMPVVWNGLTLNLNQAFPADTGNLLFIDTVAMLVDCHGSDSVVFLHLVIFPAPHVYLVDTIIENQLPWSQLGFMFSDEVDTIITVPTISTLCDSIYHYRLFVHRDIYDTVIYYVCPSVMPYTLDTGGGTPLLIWGDSIVSVQYIANHGSDSVVTYILHVIPNTDTIIVDSVLESQLPWSFFDTLFTDTVSRYPFHLYNEQGCDSTIYYSLYVFWDGDHCDTNLTFPNVVTANGDGINDRFVIGGLLENNCFKYNELHIYDRTGRLVYSFRNIASEAEWWDPNGTNDRHGHRVPDGTYFYIFKAHGVTIWTMHQGVIEVLR